MINQQNLKCKCGCEKETKMAPHTDKNRNWIKGKPLKFLHGHNVRKKTQYIVDENGCWIWQLATSPNGYGHLNINKRTITAHRYYYEKYKRKVFKGLEIDHLCRVRNCVNPEHMEVVTHSINIQRGANAKLSEKQVIDIRRLYKKGERQVILGKMFRVSRRNISHIINRTTWANL